MQQSFLKSYLSRRNLAHTWRRLAGISWVPTAHGCTLLASSEPSCRLRTRLHSLTSSSFVIFTSLYLVETPLKLYMCYSASGRYMRQVPWPFHRPWSHGRQLHDSSQAGRTTVCCLHSKMCTHRPLAVAQSKTRQAA